LCGPSPSLGNAFHVRSSRFLKRNAVDDYDKPDVTPDHLLEAFELALDQTATNVIEFLEMHEVEGEDSKRAPFLLRPFQKRLLELIFEQWSKGRAAYVIIIKARQLGFSTLIEYLLSERALRCPGFKGLTVAHDKDATQALFEKVLFASDQTPRDASNRCGIRRRTMSGTRIAYRHHPKKRGGRGKDKFGRNYSVSNIRLMTARKRQGARSTTLNGVHLSEYAHWEDLSRLDAYQSSVHDIPGNFIVIETTAFGMNEAHDVWEDACQGRGDWVPFFVAWWEHDRYVRAFDSPKEKAEFIATIGRKDPWRYGGEEESDLIEGKVGYVLRGKRYGFVPLTPEQLHWRRYWIDNKCKGSLELFHQEMPAFPDQAFTSSGMPVFNVGKLKDWQAHSRELDMQYERGNLEWHPDYRAIAADKGNFYSCPVVFEPHPLGKWTIFRDPAPGMKCAIGADVAEGLDAAPGRGDPDYSAAYVIDAMSGERLARYHAREDVSLFYMDLFKASRFYGDAWLLPEANGPGLAVIKLLEKDGFQRMINRPRLEATAEGKRDPELRPGYLTTRRSKPVLISYLQVQTDNLPDAPMPPARYCPVDAMLLKEQLSFVKSGHGKMAAEGGKHDDLVIAAALAEVAREETPDELFTEVQPDMTEFVKQIGRAYIHPDAEPYNPDDGSEEEFFGAYGED